MRLGTGARLGSYEIVAPLGAGGMGEVYRALFLGKPPRRIIKNVPSRKNTKNPGPSKGQPLTEEDLDAIACAKMDHSLRTEKRIPLAEVLKKYGRRVPRSVGR